MGKDFVVGKPMSAVPPLLALLYPRLRALPPGRWREALERARGETLDGFEIAGIGGGVALVAWLLDSPGGDPDTRSLVAEYLVQFLAALPLLAAIVSPLLLRRTRRGLEREIRRLQS